MFSLLLCSSIFWGTKVSAQTVGESEPNDTIETAQEIQMNRETAVQAATANRVNQYVVNAYTSNSDEDWYKVYLTVGTRYVICNGLGFNFSVYNEMGQTIMGPISYLRSSYGGTKSFSFAVTSAGYYYVKVKGKVDSSTSYIIGVGEPTYSTGTCTINFGSMNITHDYNSPIIDLSNESAIPDGAIICDMLFTGLRTSNASSATINNITQNYKKSLGPTLYSVNNITGVGLNVKSNWKFTIGYKKSTTINPKFNMYFVYPAVDEFMPKRDIVYTLN